MNKTISERSYYRMIQTCLGRDIQSRGGMAGQAFTSYICVACEAPNSNGDTNTPLVCPDCTKELRPKVKQMWDSGAFQCTEKDWEEWESRMRAQRLAQQEESK